MPVINSDGAGTWRRFSVQGNPGNSIRLTLHLRDLNRDGPGNDFGTDDVALMLSRADIRATLTGPTMFGADGQLGGYTVTFSNSGPQANVTRVVALPAGATLTAAQRAALSGTAFYNRGLNTITFQPVPILGSDSTTTFKFSSPAPTALGPYSLTSTVATSTPHDDGTAPGPNHDGRQRDGGRIFRDQRRRQRGADERHQVGQRRPQRCQPGQLGQYRL